VNQWNRRFFTLKGDKLAITVSETSTKIINEYPIADATVTEPAPGHNREMVISITTKANKTVIISSHNHTSLNIWYHVLMDSSHTDRTEEDHELYENPTATRASSGSPLSPASHTRRDSFSVNTSMFRVPHDSPEAQQYQQQQYAGSGGPSTPVSGLSLQPGAPIITHGAHTVVSPSAGPHTISASQLLLQAPVDVHYYKRAMEQTGGLPIDFTMNVTFSTNGRTFKPYYMCLSSRARVMMLFYQERDVTLYSSSNKSTWAYSFELHGGSLYKCDYLEHPHPCYELSLPMSTGFLSVEDAEDMETLASTMCRTTLLSLRTPDKALVIQGHKYHPTALGKHGFLWKKTGTKAWKRFFYRTEVNARGTVCLVEYTGISARATECTFLLWTSGEASCKFLRGLPHGDPWAAMEENRALETHCVTVVTASERMVLRADSEAELESWMATLISISADDFLTGPVEAPDSNHYDTLVIPPSATLQDVTNSYHILAKQYHPDRNDSADAEAAFDRIRAAYECLSNTPARLRYDQVFALMESRREVADEYRKHEKEQLLVPFESRDVLIFPERPGKRNHVPESSVFRPALPSELYITVEALHAWTTARVQIAKRRGDKPNLNMPSIANIRVSAARPDRGASTMRPLLMHSASLGPGAPSPHSHQASPVGFPASASASGASQPTTPTQHAIALSRAASLRSPASHAPATSSSSTYSPTSPQDSATASHNADLESIATTGYNSAEQQQQQQHSREQAREAKEHAKEQARKERHARRAQEELARIEAEEAKARAEAEAAVEAQRVAEEE
jgi:curved DNA-binding protein CbpA